ncbi:MAG: glutamine-hydrolyzing GMP synthase, partial [Bacilli bacterium]|nr:glutamine-hydrolyzing GMP synthase [Bacilli bacterium]
DNDILLALSGGLDSAVVCALCAKAVGKRLHAVFVDHCLLRKNEAEEVKAVFGGDSFELDFRPLDKGEYFLKKLDGVSDPEKKRKIIGQCFIDVFEQEAKSIDRPLFLAQGTIYPDRVESGAAGTGKSLIKSPHNVGGLPEDLPFLGLVEPLEDLFKDEVREIGRLLGLPEAILERQPFPGPGLAVRVKGTLSLEKLEIARNADAIFCEEIAHLANKPSQYFACLLNCATVGVKGDERFVGYVVALRAVDTDDFMTARPSQLPFELLENVAKRIVDEVEGVSRVYYDYSSKPPATIELE